MLVLSISSIISHVVSNFYRTSFGNNRLGLGGFKCQYIINPGFCAHFLTSWFALRSRTMLSCHLTCCPEAGLRVRGRCSAVAEPEVVAVVFKVRNSARRTSYSAWFLAGFADYGCIHSSYCQQIAPSLSSHPTALQLWHSVFGLWRTPYSRPATVLGAFWDHVL